MRNRRFSALLSLTFLLSLLSLSFRAYPQSQTSGVEISFPTSGEAVQGLLQIIGTTNISGFQSYQLEFTASGSTSSSWFLIHQQSTPVNNDILGEWDTSILTDGDYSLKLTVFTATDQSITVLVDGIRVRNYSPVETDTPSPTSEAPIATQSNIPTATPAPTETQSAAPLPSPTNSVSITGEKIKRSILVGGLLGLFGTLFVMIYEGYRQKH